MGIASGPKYRGIFTSLNTCKNTGNRRPLVLISHFHISSTIYTSKWQMAAICQISLSFMLNIKEEGR